MPRSPHLLAICLIAALATLGGCGSPVSDDAVARVGDREITADELLQFWADTPVLLRSEAEGVEALNDYLQTLIDMELMLLEAETLRLESDPDFRRSWEDERKRKLIFEFQLRKIMHEVEIPPAEMMERYANSKWSRVLQLARIRVPTLEQAEQIVQQLEGGRDFAEMAGERSTDRETAGHGGRLGDFLGRPDLAEQDIPLAIAEELFELEVGAFSRPFRRGDDYEVFQVVAARPAPPGYAVVFSRIQVTPAFYARRKALIDSLSQEYDVRRHPEAVALAITRLAGAPESGPLTDAEQETVLCSLRDGQITLRDLYRSLGGDGGSLTGPVDSLAVVRAIENDLLMGALFYRAAQGTEIAQDSSMVTWLATKKLEMLVQAVKDRAVDRQADLSDEAVRRYYEDHLDRFTSQVEIQVVEILVPTRERAEELLQRIGRGETIEELAVHHSTRPGADRSEGRLHMHPAKRGLFGELHAAVMKAEEGTLNGPIRIDSTRSAPAGFSIFEVVERSHPAPLPFAQAASRARYWLRQDEEARILQSLFQELRDRYAARVEVFEEHLAAIAIVSEFP